MQTAEVLAAVSAVVAGVLAAAAVRLVRQRRNLLRLIAVMAHDLKTPLNSVSGFASVMQAETYGPLGAPQYKEYAALMSDSCRYMASLVGQALAWAEASSGLAPPVATEFSVVPLIGECLDIVRGMDGAESRRFDVRVDSGLQVRLDRGYLQQIILNLLSNAVKFTAAGGRVEIAGGRERGRFVLAVSDDGEGMDKATLGRVSRPFFRVLGPRNPRGTGLGLHIVRILAARMGGRLDIQSAPAEGTRARVIFRSPS
ncbi:hypothetical protein FACS1894186_5590 [Alphaproteobacteria bacterium]|nr:hypothetical protein FACS1894186_5590 [Alphaproteobacteria bacterium]